MKLQPDILDSVNAIRRIEPGRLWVGQTPHVCSIVVPWRGAVAPWPARGLGDLTAAHFEALLPLQPEVVIFGSGAVFERPGAHLYAALIEQRIGLEAMATAAACRTFNVLALEGRRVVAALLLPLAN